MHSLSCDTARSDRVGGSSLKVSVNPFASHFLAECQGLFSCKKGMTCGQRSRWVARVAINFNDGPKRGRCAKRHSDSYEAFSISPLH